MTEPTSTIIRVADAVVSELNGGTFSQKFTAARFYRPIFDLKDMSDLHVSVVPKGIKIGRADRYSNMEDLAIDIAIQQKFETGDNAELDALMALTQEIADFFCLRRLAAYPSAIWIGTENVPVYAPDHLEELRQFTSVLTLTFRVLVR